MGQILVIGLLSGVIYSLFAVGVVLVYRGSGAINFAQGEIGTLSLFVAWWVATDQGLPWVAGAVAALAFAVASGVGFERLVVRHMVSATRIAVGVATVGLLSFLLAVELRLFSASPRVIEPPIGGLGVEVAGVFVSPNRMLSIALTAVVAAALTWFLKRTDFGLGVLAAAQDPDAVRLVGVPLARVSAFVWGAGAGLSALAALLITPDVGVFAPGFATELFVKGLAAAVIGGLTSLPGAFAGGLIVGLLEQVAVRNVTTTALPAADFVVVLAAIIVVLLVRPQGVLTGLRLPWRPAAPAPAPTPAEVAS